MEQERVLVNADDARKLGLLLKSQAGKEIKDILDRTFGSRLSYTRGEPEHTAFLEGQKSLLGFMENAVKLIKAEDE